MRYLGIDYGTKKIGLALSDENGSMGFPHSILPNTPRLVGDLLALAAKEGVGAIVIGDSKDYHGRDNAVAVGARALGEVLSERAGLPVFYEWEGLTSAEARRAPEKMQKSRAPSAHPDIDSSAAALILTSYLSKEKHA
ncbi:MAG: Holliday junction resolvase RuvX [bacterium]